MCGIVGIINSSFNEILRNELVEEQLKLIKNRGPDDEGIYSSEYSTLGHVRLSIIDKSGGHQPLISDDRNYIIVFNGEIYNYIELRNQLIQNGCSFRTTSDTEVLLNSYIVYGTKCLEYIDGMYSFAILSLKDKSIFCARDPFGQKPFYYSHKPDSGFCFSSELKTFFKIPGFEKKISTLSSLNFLTFEGFYGEDTIHSEIKKLLPGHYLIYKNNKIITDTFRNSIPNPNRITDINTAVNDLDKILRESISNTYRADVPVSVLLSGGLDSSIIVMMLRSLYPDGEISTFNFRINHPDYDESYYAKSVAFLGKTNHKEVFLEISNLAETALKVPAILDEPQADPGIIPNYLVCREIHNTQNRVALTGAGSDELFYGYIIFKAELIARYYKHLPTKLIQYLIQSLLTIVPSGFGYMKFDFLLKQFLKGFPSSEYNRNWLWVSSFAGDDFDKLTNTTVSSDELSGMKFLKNIYDQSSIFNESTYLGRFAYQYQKTYLPSYVLANSDRASMLNSIEIRTPFLNNKIVDFSNSLPDNFKLHGFSTKYILKKVAERYMPRDLIYRKKMGFTIPVALLLKDYIFEEVQETILNGELIMKNVVSRKYIEQLLKNHKEQNENNYKKIWTLFSLERWISANGFSI